MPEQSAKPTALQTVMKRRSYRCFKPIAVPDEILTTLLNETRFAPSAKNERGMQFAVLSRAVMEEILPVVLEAISSVDEKTAIEPHGMPSYDRVFHGAPQVLLGISPRQQAQEDAIIALTTFELLAQANGLATLWSGALKHSATLSQKVKDAIGLPPELDLCGALCIGYPDITYHRPPTRIPFEVRFCE